MSGRPSRQRLVAGALAVALAGSGAATAALATAAGAPAASAPASIRLNHGCYQTAQKAGLRGRGFDPSSHWAATLDGSAFGHGTTDSSGAISATFGVPSRLRRHSTGEDSYKLVVRERRHSAKATFLVTHLNASFSPANGDPSTLKVRFRLLGWGRGGSLYLHYVTAKGFSRWDRNLGAPAGACGHLTTSLLRLFPFAPKVGKWTLQFDRSAVYKAGTVPRVAIPYKIS